MTVSQVYSSNLTNILLTTSNILNIKQGLHHLLIDTQEVPLDSLDEVGDSFLFGPIPSNSVITDVQFLNDLLDSDGNLAGNVGLFYTGVGGTQNERGVGTNRNVKSLGEVISANCVASATKVLSCENTAPASIRFGSGDIKNIGYPAWQLGGLTEDPGGYFSVRFTVTTVAGTSIAGDVTCLISYLVS